jgi:multiple RNA-binding domain-containing protein 1
VVSSVADRLKVSKADILNPDSDDAAVKLALAETHVIQETKKYLEDVGVICLPEWYPRSFIAYVQEGVILDSFKSRQRSETIILVKNIPYGTSIDELNEMFSPHGEIVRLLLPPAGTMGVVEFSHSSEASKALRAIAYRRLKNSIIYLEKAPLGMFKEDEPGHVNKKFSSGVKPVIAPSHDLVALEESGATDAAESTTAVGGATLFVKNLSFSTTTDRLVKTFRNLTSFSFARVQTKPDPKRSGSTLSMGYGFIGFKDPEAAKKAIKSVQGFNLDGHTLQASFAQRGVDDASKEGAKVGGVGKSLTTKMIVKNLPFEVTKKDVRALFRSENLLLYMNPWVGSYD